MKATLYAVRQFFLSDITSIVHNFGNSVVVKGLDSYLLHASSFPGLSALFSTQISLQITSETTKIDTANHTLLPDIHLQ